MAILERFFTFNVFTALLISLFPVEQKNQNAVEQLKKLRSQAETRMSARIVEQPAFTVAGIAVRTSNAKEMSADGMIGKQWARLMQEDLLAKIPNKADASIVAVYSDYASDKDGDYTYLLGARVTSDAGVPSEWSRRRFSAESSRCSRPKKVRGRRLCLRRGGASIRCRSASVGGDRLYQADFEVYDERAEDPQNLQADVYVGIR